MVRVLSPEWEYLLSRPFSFCRVEDTRIELLFEVIGKGTRSLSEAKEGSLLEIVGPLGKGFSPDPACDAVLVGGGMGVAPLPFLASELAKASKSAKLIVLLGAKTADGLCLREAFGNLGAEVKLATDDGTAGHHGPVTDLLQEELDSRRRAPGPSADVRGSKTPGRPEEARGPIVYACGPRAMLREVARLTSAYRVPCQVSVEERMACGVGACMSCACKTQDPDGNEHFKRVCVEGPVFDAAELVFDEH